MKSKGWGYCQDTVGLKDWWRDALDAGLELWEKAKSVDQKPTTNVIIGTVCLSFLHLTNSM